VRNDLASLPWRFRDSEEVEAFLSEMFADPDFIKPPFSSSLQKRFAEENPKNRDRKIDPTTGMYSIHSAKYQKRVPKTWENPPQRMKALT